MCRDTIEKTVSELCEKYDSCDPFELAEDVGIFVSFADLGSLNGMYVIQQGIRLIIINQNLDEQTQAVICAHELAHDQLHREWAEDPELQTVMLYDMQRKPERDANLFAAELLIDEDELLETMEYAEYTVGQLSSIFEVPEELMRLKLEGMSKRFIR